MMQNEHLKKLLNELPRVEASERFTDTVMERISSGRTPRPLVSSRSWLAAAAAVVILVIGAAHVAFEQREQARLEAIAAQHRALETEIAELRNQADFDPVVELGEDDGVRYILDLRPVEVQPIRTAALQPDFY